MFFSSAPPNLHLPTSVKPQEKPPVTLKCLNCNEEFSDLYYLEIHNEIHKPANKDNQNDHVQNNEQFNCTDVNTPEWDENSDQSNESNNREMEIKLEITNIVTLKDQIDCVHDNSKNNEHQHIEVEANEDFAISKQIENFEPMIEDNSEQEPMIENNSEQEQMITDNSEQECIVKNNEQLTNDSDCERQKYLITSDDVEDEATTRVDQDENSVDQVENKEHCEAELTKTKEDTILVNNRDKEENDLAKEMLLKTDA